MKLAVIAANGRSGRVFVEAALAAGHQIRAGVHKHNTLGSDDQLTVVQCEATSEADLENLLTGQDAVVSLIGHVKGSPPDIQTAAMQQTITVMHDLGIRRLVSLTGTGVRFPEDKITLMDRLLNLGLRIVDPARLRDGRNAVALLQHSDLDWTVVRVLKLQNIAVKPFTLREHGPPKLFVGREEVAQAILEVLQNDSSIKKAPIISPAR